jgi:hypothetical protein
MQREARLSREALFLPEAVASAAELLEESGASAAAGAAGNPAR